MTRRLVRYMYRSASNAELVNLPWQEACTRFVQNAMSSYAGACQEKSWFYDLELGELFGKAAFEILAASKHPDRPTYKEVAEHAEREFQTWLDQTLHDKAMWIAVEDIFADKKTQDKVFTSLKKTYQAQLKGGVRAASFASEYIYFLPLLGVSEGPLQEGSRSRQERWPQVPVGGGSWAVGVCTLGTLGAHALPMLAGSRQDPARERLRNTEPRLGAFSSKFQPRMRCFVAGERFWSACPECLESVPGVHLRSACPVSACSECMPGVLGVLQVLTPSRTQSLGVCRVRRRVQGSLWSARLALPRLIAYVEHNSSRVPPSKAQHAAVSTDLGL